LSTELETVHLEIVTCIKCELHKGRKKAVPGDGPVGAMVMFVGEGPGEKEDQEGRPFVGAAGKLLTELLGSVGLDRSQVFITNIVKCRPPNNRAPRQGEIDACNPYLEDQIRLVGPRILCPLGTPAIRTLMGAEYSAGAAHGKPVRMKERIVLPLYHPAAALYDSSLKDVMFRDFSMLKQLIQAESQRDTSHLSGSEENGEKSLQKWM
jgi:uracil-DNA glycosylase